MARPLRYQLAGGVYHLTHRGNRRQKIFRADRDREAFLDRLWNLSGVFDCRVHAYCLMDNHVHLLIETRRANLSAFAQRFFSSYTLWHNKKHDASGHLFQGRYHSELVQKGAYLAEVSRYIHLNPVRAGIVRRPETYAWGSMGHYAPGGRRNERIFDGLILEPFGGDRGRYHEFVLDGVGSKKDWNVVNRVVVGSAEYARRIKERLKKAKRGKESDGADRDERETGRRMIRAMAETWEMREMVLRRRGGRRGDVGRRRCIAMHALRSRTMLTLREIGEMMGAVSEEAVAFAVRKAREDRRLRKEAARIEHALT